MKKYSFFIAPLALLLLFTFASCSDPYHAQGSYPNDDYGRYPNNRYPNDRYGRTPDDRYTTGWAKIASKRVGNNRNYEVINLNSRTRGISQLRFDINDQYTQIRRVLVTLDNGRTQELAVRRINDDRYGNNRNRNYSYGNSYMADIPRNSYGIRQVAYWISEKGYANNRATVTVFGR